MNMRSFLPPKFACLLLPVCRWGGSLTPPSEPLTLTCYAFPSWNLEDNSAQISPPHTSMETFRRAVRCLADPRCLFFARVSQEKNGRSRKKKGLKLYRKHEGVYPVAGDKLSRNPFFYVLVSLAISVVLCPATDLQLILCFGGLILQGVVFRFGKVR